MFVCIMLVSPLASHRYILLYTEQRRADLDKVCRAENFDILNLSHLLFTKNKSEC